MILKFFSGFRLNVARRLEETVDPLSHDRLRLRILFVIAALKFLNFLGGAWDIQWHVEIGRDSLFIPPHLLVIAAFSGGLLLTIAMVLYETGLARRGQRQPHSVRLWRFFAPRPFFVVLAAYTGALLSGLFDELWHRLFGIDATLWSPPHMMIMVATVVVDFSLLFGITSTARRISSDQSVRSPYFWGIVLAGCFLFESVNFQMGEALIVGFRHKGEGLYGLLFPLLVGAAYPLSLMACLRLSRRYWIGVLILVLTIALQLLATGVAAAGFAILQPPSIMDIYVLQYPTSTAAVSRNFARLLGHDGLIGIHQAWTMLLSLPAFTLVALTGASAAARKRPLLLAPIFSAANVILSYVWFQFTPVLQNYPIDGAGLLLAVGISAAAGSMLGWLGWTMAGRSEGAAAQPPSGPTL